MVTDENGNELKPNFTVHPGGTVLDNLIIAALSAKGFITDAVIWDDDYIVNIIASYIRGERLVTEDVLDIIAVMAEMEPDNLLRLQNNFEAAVLNGTPPSHREEEK